MREEIKMRKKMLSWILTVAMVLSLFTALPITANAQTGACEIIDVDGIIPAIQWACGAGVMQGDGAKLDPQGSATRAQVAAMLMRFIENVAK